MQHVVTKLVIPNIKLMIAWVMLKHVFTKSAHESEIDFNHIIRIYVMQ